VRRAIEAVATSVAPPTWESVVEPMTIPLDRLDRAWGAVRHLHAVVDTPELREAYNAVLPDVVALYTDMGQDLRLYDRYRALRASPAHALLDAALATLASTGSALEEARTRLHRAELHRAADEREPARAAATRARDAFAQLGAAHDRARAETFLANLG